MAGLIWQKASQVPLPALEDGAAESSELKFAYHDYVESKLFNLIIAHPEIASPTILRTDILSDTNDEFGDANIGSSNAKLQGSPAQTRELSLTARKAVDDLISSFCPDNTRQLLLNLIPRNPRRDKVLAQSAWVLSRQTSASCTTTTNTNTNTNTTTAKKEENAEIELILAPHVDSLLDIPFYHPRCFALAVRVSNGIISIEYLLSELEVPAERYVRMSQHLLSVAAKHISNPTYLKRFNHDIIVPRQRYQSKYQEVKERHAWRLCNEIFNDGKQREKDKTFEELAIASWLICIWEDAYERSSGDTTTNSTDTAGTTSSLGTTKKPWKGFVDVGCGNGVLVDVLNREGWTGWGFDARARKSWSKFDDDMRSKLHEMVLIPYILLRSIKEQERLKEASAQIYQPDGVGNILKDIFSSSLELLSESLSMSSQGEEDTGNTKEQPRLLIHPGLFTDVSFVISNHGDELTPWTPVLASLSMCDFLVIPCCSHDLSGKRFRAPPPALTLEDRKKGKESAYQSLVDYLIKMCIDLNVNVEKEWLRIPSTRNLALLGRFSGNQEAARELNHGDNGAQASLLTFQDREKLIEEVLRTRGGADGWVDVSLGLKQKQLQSGIH